jgi:hypothetical protein
VEYERWCATRDDTILASIAFYNEQDCISTAKLHAWLEDRRPAGVAYERSADFGDGQDARAAARSEREARKQGLAARIRASPKPK